VDEGFDRTLIETHSLKSTNLAFER